MTTWRDDPEWRIRVAEAEANDDGALCVSDGEAAVAAYKRTAIAEVEKLRTSTIVGGAHLVYLAAVLAVLEDSPDA